MPGLRSFLMKTTRRCPKQFVNSNFDPENALFQLNATKTLEEAKDVFTTEFLVPMKEGRFHCKPQKLNLFTNSLERFKHRDQVLALAYNITLAGEGLGQAGNTYHKNMD